MNKYLVTLLILSICGNHVTANSSGGQEWPYNNFTAGLTFAVSAEKWQEFKNANWQYFNDIVMLINMTNIEMGGNLGYMRENTYNVSSNTNQATFTLVPEDNAVLVTCEGIEAIFISETARIRKGILTLSGHAESMSHNMSINNEIIWSSIPAADFNQTGRRLMGIKSGYSVVRIDRSQLEFLFEGNLLASISNVFSDSVLPIIMGNVEEALALQINNELPPVVNELFRTDDAYMKLFPSDGSMPKYEDFIIDFAVNQAPKVTKDYIGFSVKALWFNKIQGYREIPNRGDVLPMWLPQYKNPLQIMANKYFWDGFCQTYIESNPGWGFNLTQDQLGKSSPIQLDTYKLNLWFPGIRDRYAAYNNPATKSGLKMRAFFEFLNITDWNAWESTQRMGAKFDLILHLNVTMPDGTEECAMQWLMESYHWNITMIVKRLIFHAKLETGYLENIRLLYCNFCDEYPLDMILYKEVFNTVLLPETLVLQTFFNPVLAAIPIKWPAEIMDIAQLSDVEFHYGDGFIYMGTEMAWVPFPAPTKLLAKKVMPEPTMKKAHRNSKF